MRRPPGLVVPGLQDSPLLRGHNRWSLSCLLLALVLLQVAKTGRNPTAPYVQKKLKLKRYGNPRAKAIDTRTTQRVIKKGGAPCATQCACGAASHAASSLRLCSRLVSARRPLVFPLGPCLSSPRRVVLPLVLRPKARTIRSTSTARASARGTLRRFGRSSASSTARRRCLGGRGPGTSASRPLNKPKQNTTETKQNRNKPNQNKPNRNKPNRNKPKQNRLRPGSTATRSGFRPRRSRCARRSRGAPQTRATTITLSRCRLGSCPRLSVCLSLRSVLVPAPLGFLVSACVQSRRRVEVRLLPHVRRHRAW